MLRIPDHPFYIKWFITKCIYYKGIKLPNIANNQPIINIFKFIYFYYIYINTIIPYAYIGHDT